MSALPRRYTQQLFEPLLNIVRLKASLKWFLWSQTCCAFDSWFHLNWDPNPVLALEWPLPLKPLLTHNHRHVSQPQSRHTTPFPHCWCSIQNKHIHSPVSEQYSQSNLDIALSWNIPSCYHPHSPDYAVCLSHTSPRACRLHLPRTLTPPCNWPQCYLSQLPSPSGTDSAGFIFVAIKEPSTTVCPQQMHSKSMCSSCIWKQHWAGAGEMARVQSICCPCRGPGLGS